MSDYMIGLDQGSTSSKAVLVNRRGRIVRSVRAGYRTHRRKSGRVEIPPGAIWNSQFNAVKKILAGLRKKKDRVAGMGIANQRSTVVLWDRDSGKPLGPAISWQDRRADDIIGRWSGKKGFIRSRTGLMLTPYYSAPKIRWVLDRLKGARSMAREGRLLCGTVNAFLIWRLTRGAVYATDHTNAARMLLMNLKTLKWDDGLLDLFGIPPSCLPDLRFTLSDYGLAKIAGWEIPIRASIGDQQAGLLGLGAVRPGDAVLNYGTGGFFIVNTGKERIGAPGILDSLGVTLSGRSFYVAEGTVNAVGSVFEWLENSGLVRKTGEMERLIRESRNRVYFVPALNGLASPHWNSGVRMGFLGMDAKTTRADLVKAVFEGIAFLFKDIDEAMRNGGKIRIGRISAAGGGSRFSGLLQIQADFLGKPVTQSNNTEATAYGAARLAGIEAGWWGMGDPNSLAPAGRVFHPRTTAAERRRLHGDWKKILRVLLDKGSG